MTVVKNKVQHLVSLVIAGIIAVAGGVLLAPAAAAHGGPIELTLAPDGAGGFQLFAHYEEDGHLVEAILDPVVEAVATDGRTAGPVTLVSGSEGQGRWVTSEPMLDEGEWSVTVTTTTPEEATLTTDIVVESPEPPPAPAPVEQAAHDEPAAAADPVESAAEEGTAGPVPPWAIVSLAAVLVVGAALLVWRKRRA